MATRMLRRGLPRVRGGEPWPPAGSVDADTGERDAAETDTVAAAEAVHATAPAASAAAPAASATTPAASAAAAGVPAVATEGAVSTTVPVPAPAGSIVMRRGLPRVRGGEPAPPAGIAPASTGEPGAEGVPTASASTPSHAASGTAPATAAPASAASASASASARAASEAPRTAGGLSSTATPPSAPTADAGLEAPAMRRGLPRTRGGEPWPPAGVVPVLAAPEPAVSPEPLAAPETAASPAPAPATASAPETGAVARRADVSAPLRWTPTVWNGTAPRHLAAVPASDRRRPTWTQAIAALFAAAGLGVLAGSVVALVRAGLSLPVMQDFLAAYPGEYEPAIAVQPGFAPWVGWQHFFNMFLMVLIIRSGLTIRREKRPTAFWTPRNNPKGKVSLTIWFHQALDILWLVNGVIFVVLLFATGHWVRIVPTSWEVIPNAVSAALQYVSLDWPHENGWNNYNSLQQLAYFATVFLAAPLAAATGFRMSGLWPKKAERLSKAYPIEWARAVHFPVMLYFVAFIVVHVALVFLTGMLANLNHMFASTDAVTWTGFWVFAASVVVIAIGWAAARPLVIAPIAKVFGTVSGR
ncbi:cytochrome b/b6 domain-containing protein [Microbacterium sp. XT11]|uniref:cytochrome b/b6 domain-containing protein n=1 Tax=Microbacterium sp. XT11 TaxID=367477 RepID=UPI000742DBD7|nr:cytochrome b/b6 domain-containing protein [Microbacterium sp. XT11]ALX65720.1 hypothetical protein AB663_000393 [Microbacterium sp. XT11]